MECKAIAQRVQIRGGWMEGFHLYGLAQKEIVIFLCGQHRKVYREPQHEIQESGHDKR
jgi:hypothetical protein